MQVEYLIIGQGISGSWLSYYLQKKGRSFLVIDKENKNSPSAIAAGVINPVTGRRHAEVWMAEELFPFIWKAYHEMGKELGITAISHKNIIDFFPSPQMKVSFLQRLEEQNKYVHSYPEQNQFNHLFQYDFGCGEIRPVYIAHLETLLPAWKQKLWKENLLLVEEFDNTQLQLTADGVQYKDVKAGKIIFCDGNSSAVNPYFSALPFAPNKGEVLMAEIPGLSPTNIYKKGMMLVPLTTPGLWWVGSSYAWEFDNENPTEEFREKTEALLKSWLKIPFTITEHLAGVRPATLERRPFVGIHPLHPNIGILNGMGTKGCSLAPFFARQLADHLTEGSPIYPEADITRFSKILSRQDL